MTSTQEKSMASMQPGPVPRAQGSARRMSVESVLNEVEVEAGAVPRGSQDLSRLSVSSRQCQVGAAGCPTTFVNPSRGHL
jgi:hypothetical protein